MAVKCPHKGESDYIFHYDKEVEFIRLPERNCVVCGNHLGIEKVTLKAHFPPNLSYLTQPDRTQSSNVYCPKCQIVYKGVLEDANV